MRKALFTAAATGLLVAASAPAAFAQDMSGEEIVAGLPADLAVQYEFYPGDITPAALPEMAAGDGPWKMCHSESFQGNPWRVALSNELSRMADEFIAAGKMSEWKQSDSNGDVALQIAQVQAFIDEGCDIITLITATTTGLNEAIGNAVEAGIPVVTISGRSTHPQAINVDSDFYTWGYEMADSIGNEIGEGNIIVVEGIAGAPIVADQEKGRNAALANHPGINVVATVNGDWSPTTTKNVITQTLATNPADVDAVWTSGSEARLVTEAFIEAGREAPLVTGSITGDNLGYWNENPDGYRFTGHAVLPVPAANSGFRVAMRILEGQEPVLNTMLVPFPKVTQDQLGDWFSECFTSDSGSLFPVAASDPYPDEMIDAYFSNPAPTAPYDYATTPDPCG